MAQAPLSNSYNVSEAQADTFRQNGHILLREVVPADELKPYRDEIVAVTTEYAKSYKPLEQRDTYGKAFIQYTNLWEKNETIREFTLSERLGKIAAELMGVKSVRVYHDQALFKEPNGGRTPIHQDQQYWPLDGVKCCTLWMPLVDATANMGTLNFATGSQTLGNVGSINISDDSDVILGDVIKKHGFEVVNAGDMKAGDATFHDGWCIHGAPGNASSTTTREVMTIIYYDADAVVSTPDSSERENDLKAWFPGLKPGDKAASRLNPVAYTAAD
jgi:ectoine hydroxylase-related dioxygenase (phytanoyl-CoA dioxygenase family)